MALALFNPPAGLTYPITRSPLMSTLSQESISGKDNPIALWLFPRYRWTLSFDFARSDSNNEFQYLLAFFIAQKGKANTWLYQDADDNTATAAALSPTPADGVTRSFGMLRDLGGLGLSLEPVFAPNASGLKFFDNGADVTGHVTLGASGLATWDVAPAAGHVLTWTGTFNWIVRFDADTLDFEKQFSTIYMPKKFTFTSVPVTWT